MRNTIYTHANKGFNAAKILKIYIFILVLGLYSLGALANPPLASKQQVGMFKNSKTCVVLENSNIPYSTNIKDAVQKYWKSTEYEFIDQQEFDKRRSSSKYSFLVLTKGVFEKDPGGVSYSYIRLVLGDAANDIASMPEFCSIPLSYSDDNNTDYEYVIPAIIKFMQKHVKNLENKHLFISLNGLKYYNGSAGLNNKVLLLNKDRMAPNANSTEKILTVYPYNVRLLTSSEIQKELAINPTSTLFNFHVGPGQNTGAGKCFDMIFDVEGNLYYYNYRKITNDNEDGFNLKDFQKIR
jgi:hypothetical protein